MVKRFIISLFAILCLAISAIAEIDTHTGIFDRRFKTLKVEVEDNFMSPPVIRMGTNDHIIIKFDEIAEDNSYLEYRLLHCNADWQPSRLIESEFVDGFNSQRIEDYAFSSATFVHYVNYLISLPNDDMQIMHSGNYLLQVYDPDDPDTTILQARFQVSENSMQTLGQVTSRTDMGHNTEWQQLAFTINTGGFSGINPYQDLYVTVEQNCREITRRAIKAPLRVEGDMLIYDHIKDLVYPASNEYRRFESVSTAFTGIHVDSLRYMGSNYHVWLKPDGERATRQYSYDRTQHGRFIVREYNATDSDVGADYITAHFLLYYPELINADIYVDGEFSFGKFDNSNRMIYDRNLEAYTAQIPLKQGAYNYQYVVVSRDGNHVSTDHIEGNKYETENEYGVAVYFRPPGARADRLVSYNVFVYN